MVIFNFVQLHCLSGLAARVATKLVMLLPIGTVLDVWLKLSGELLGN